MNSTIITFLLNTTMTITTMNVTDNATVSFGMFVYFKCKMLILCIDLLINVLIH